MIKIIDNLLTPSYADAIEQDVRQLHYLYSAETSYYTGKDAIIKTDMTFDVGQFVCPILPAVNHQITPHSNYFNSLKPLVYTIQDVFSELKLTDVVRIKTNLLLQANIPEGHYNVPHQDANHECYTMVYYCNDSDGDTFLFEEFWEDDSNLPNKLTVRQRITPKKNRLVLFESNRYHASSNPSKNKERFVINIVMVHD